MIDQALYSLFADWHRRPFAWGTTDCCQWAATAVQRLHGRTPPATPPYCTQRAALRVVRSLGGYEGMLRAVGMVPVPVQTARRGDVAIVRASKSDALFGGTLAVVTGVQAHTTGPCGLVSIKRCNWLAVWGVRNA